MNAINFPTKAREKRAANLVPRSHSVLHLAVGDLGTRLAGCMVHKCAFKYYQIVNTRE